MTQIMISDEDLIERWEEIWRVLEWMIKFCEENGVLGNRNMLGIIKNGTFRVLFEKIYDRGCFIVKIDCVLRLAFFHAVALIKIFPAKWSETNVPWCTLNPCHNAI